MSVIPFDSNTSDVKRIVNGKSLGIIGFNPFSAKAPWPSSRLPSGPIRPVSFVANGGNS